MYHLSSEKGNFLVALGPCMDHLTSEVGNIPGTMPHMHLIYLVNFEPE